MAAYVVIVVTLVGSAYVAAAVSTGQAQRVGQMVRWSLGFLPRRNYWSRPPRAFVYAAVGATRALVGGQLVHSIPEWKTSIERWFPRNDPVDERYFVRTVTRPIAWLYAGFTLLALVSLGALLAMCTSSVLTSGFRGVGFNAALLAVWLATYCGFFTFWDPSNPDFWVVQVFLTPLLVVAVLARIPPNGLETSLLLVLAVSLLVVNGLGTVQLARDPANDYYTVYLRSVA